MSETTAKVMKKKPMAKGGKGKLHELSFKGADNGGAISESTHENTESKDGEYHSPIRETTIHPTMAHAVKHMKATMGGFFPAKAAAAAPAGGDGDGDEDDE